MAASPEFRQAFIDWCQRAIDERREQIAPLESGKVHAGRKGPDTGFEWVDVTAAHIERLKNEIASLESAMARNERTDA
jgi:hypothetical protein